MLAALVLSVLSGCLIPAQTAINSQLSGRLGAILPASLVAFAVGSVGLGLAAVLTGTPLPLAATATSQPWWIWLGGACGLVLLTMNIVLLSRIGASATVVLPLIGQVLGGLAIDVTGALGMMVRPLTQARALGTLLVVSGGALVNFSGRGRTPLPSAPRSRSGALLWLVAVATGTLAAIQTAVNGRLGEAMGSGLAAALVSFLIATGGMAVITMASGQRASAPGRLPAWLFSGGPLGAGFVLVSALNAPILGTSLTVSAALLGQVVGGLVLDQRGWLGVPRRPATPLRLVGALVLISGVALVRFG